MFTLGGITQMAIIIKTFQTPYGKYVYDRGTSSILVVEDTEFDALKRIEAGAGSDEDMKLLRRYVKQGYLPENSIKKIAYLEKFQFDLNSHVRALTLQVTQDCNLRCSYCVYGGGYEHQRTHNKKRMPLDTMKKAVDFAMARSREVDEFALGLYGGEPLLAMDSIRSCIGYVKEHYAGRKFLYTITTNGTLLNDDNISFFIENGVRISISFDGPRELHDMNRVYADGRGSFDDIMRKMEYIKERYPEFFEKISFLSTIAPGVDFSCVNDFFEAETVISDSAISTNTVNSYSAKKDVVYDELYYSTATYQQMKALMAALGLYSEKKVSKLFRAGLSQAELLYQSMPKTRISDTAHPGGPCIPGAMRLFVSTDGTLYPCERVSEGSEVMKIGHVDTGFDLAKIENLLNVGRLTEEECKTCWNFFSCNLCCAAADGGAKLSRDERLRNCVSAMAGTLNQLRTICLLLENGYDFEFKAREREAYKI